MFNHGPLSSTVHGYQESNDCLHLVTLQDWASSSEVKFSYGPLPNSRLLLLHGFCLPDNPFESVELWAMMEPGAPGFAEKSKVGVGAGREDGSAKFPQNLAPLRYSCEPASNKFCGCQIKIEI